MKRAGFTLIELLVVIAIIAVLAAILFPMFSNAKKSAMVNNCLNNLKQMGFGMQAYVDDNSGRFPYAGADSNNIHTPGTPPWGMGGSKSCWAAIKPYVRNDEVRWCPFFKATYPAYKQYMSNATTRDIAWSYWYYCGHNNRWVTDYDTATSGPELCGYGLSDITAPSKKPCICEVGSIHLRGKGYNQWWSAVGIFTYGIAYVDGHAKMLNCNSKTTILKAYVRRDGSEPKSLGPNHQALIQ